MAWQAFHRCSCCQECVFLEGVDCRLHGDNRRLCDGNCPDRTLEHPNPIVLLTDDERARCLQFAERPVARFPLLTVEEMRRLLWFNEYFGTREHEVPTRIFPGLSAQEVQEVRQFIHPDAA